MNGLKGDGTLEDATALNNLITYAETNNRGLYFPSGTFLLPSKISSKKSGMKIFGAGIYLTTIKANTAFSDTGVFILGDKETTLLTGSVLLSDLSIECNGQAHILQESIDD